MMKIRYGSVTEIETNKEILAERLLSGTCIHCGLENRAMMGLFYVIIATWYWLIQQLISIHNCYQESNCDT